MVVIVPVGPLLKINAVVGLVTGIGLVLAPTIVLNILGATTDPTGTNFARLYGAELIGFNVATWLASSGDARSQRMLVLGHVANESLTAVIAVIAAGSGLGDVLLWGVALLAGAFALAFSVVATQRSWWRA